MASKKNHTARAGGASSGDDPARSRSRRLIERFSFPALAAPLVVLAGITGYALFVSSDAKVNALFTPCLSPESSSPGPFTSVPIVGPPTCCLVSFFHAALSSRRSAVIMGEILSYVAAALTALTVESARFSNQSSWVIRNPTPSWLLFNLAGGAVVWQLIMVPAFLHHGQKRVKADTSNAGEPGRSQAQAQAYAHVSSLRLIPSSEVRAIPVAVALGFVLPSIPFVDSPRPWWILIWLFFPAYVSIVRQLARRVIPPASRQPVMHPEFDGHAFFTIYALPILCSVVSHYALLYDLFLVRDDRTPTTRAALQFIILDLSAIGLTVLYLLIAESGTRVAMVSVATGLIVGPGAGLCFGWVAREWDIKSGIARSPARVDKDK